MNKKIFVLKNSTHKQGFVKCIITKTYWYGNIPWLIERSVNSDFKTCYHNDSYVMTQNVINMIAYVVGICSTKTLINRLIFTVESYLNLSSYKMMLMPTLLHDGTPYDQAPGLNSHRRRLQETEWLNCNVVRKICKLILMFIFWKWYVTGSKKLD